MPKLFACFVLLFATITFALGQQLPKDAVMSKTFGAAGKAAAIESKNIYLVKTTNPIAGVPGTKVLRRLAFNYYVVASDKNLTTGGAIASVSPANNIWKADDNLINVYQRSPQKKVTVTLATKQKNAAPTFSTVKIKLADLPQILTDTTITAATLVRKPHTELTINDLDLGENNIDAIAALYPTINGSGIKVSVKEEQFDKDDLDLLGRTFKSIDLPENNSAHATIMATLIGGSGNSFIKGKGAAPEVNLTSSDFSRLLPDTITAFKDFGIGLQNHSYGTGIENFYGIEAAAYDQQIYESDTLLHVFSSGNIGTTAPSTGIYSGISNMANLSGTFKQAKNVLVVGGTGLTGIPEDMSSAGPAYDGRVKPELVADGEDGTSGAAALVSGSAALLKQAYRLKYNQSAPSALIKGLLINTADDIGNANVDFKTGFGKLNALEALRSLNAGDFKTGSLQQGSTNTFQITIPANCYSFKTTLTWADPAADINAANALVNDLDMKITGPDGKTYLPWVLSYYPSADSLRALAKQGRDSLNNVEQITLQAPQAGVYTISVSAKRIKAGDQKFFISFQSKLSGQFEWISPTALRPLIPGEDAYLRWQNTYANANGTLSISYDKGQTWQQLSAAVDLSQRYFKWQVPDAFTQARIKMQIGNSVFTSTDFVISAPRTVQVGFNCTTGLLLHWNPQPNATGYNIYTINNNRLVQLKSVTDTSSIILPQQQTSRYYAVSAVGSGFEGIKSYTIDATAQGVGCYVRTLIATPANKTQITIDLSIGSTQGLASITWQRLTGKDSYTTIGKTSVKPAAFNYNFIDNNPQAGLNYYRAVLTKTDNSVIYSDLASATLLQVNQFIMYPNPVSTQLNIIAGDTQPYTLTLYDMAGRKAFNANFNNFQNQITLTVLPGVYVGIITLNGKILYSSKIVKLP
ncbi:S8 family peptidase [Mucilaginibacter sp. 21P]|uniref:S8 family peptidase n=1 Tax=Mucilaginibacter sp. 21P TaxID=2778902 RepID=UPI001C56439D|nr:S8 family peptidase [Mucilaginibacter sp. 21P]QXV65476.1 S8 family peptidase [Mucilaginibacter sp. 21P]